MGSLLLLLLGSTRLFGLFDWALLGLLAPGAARTRDYTGFFAFSFFVVLKRMQVVTIYDRAAPVVLRRRTVLQRRGLGDLAAAGEYAHVVRVRVRASQPANQALCGDDAIGALPGVPLVAQPSLHASIHLPMTRKEPEDEVVCAWAGFTSFLEAFFDLLDYLYYFFTL